MGDLAADTAVSGGEGRYSAVLSRDWEIWGPNGGYVASVALRAAGVHSRFTRPASIVAHYLGVADFDTVDLTVTTLRAARRAESLRVSMTQRGEPILDALVWAVGDLGGLEHDVTARPDVPAPDTLPSMEERLAARGEQPMYRFWENFDQRPIDWIDDWEHRAPSEPAFQEWFRYRPRATFDDPWVDACRALVLVDTLPWPATVRLHVRPTHMAPSIDLAVQFHRARPEREWLLARAEAPTASGGLVGGHVSVWSDDGALLATGTSQLLCRPATPR